MHTKPVVGKLRKLRRLTAHESSFLLQHAPRPFKVTMPTPIRPNQLTIPAPYASLQEIHEDITAIFRDEMTALADEGVTYLQLDKVPTRFVDPQAREAMRARGVDPDAEFAAEVALENSCYDAARREGITLAMHFCRGSRLWWQGGSGPYEAIAEQAFVGLHADRYLLEYDSEKAGGFEPLRFVPKGKSVHLGLVSTKTPELEDQDALLRRIDEASRIHRPGPAWHRAAVRLPGGVGARRRPHHHRRAAAQAGADCGHGSQGLGVRRRPLRAA